MLGCSFAFILVAETISGLGSQITIVALPLAAVVLLHATPFQMGQLSGAGALPGVLFGLFAGVLIEQSPKRQVLVAANFLSALVLFAVPLGQAGRLLSVALLIAVSFIATALARAEGIALLSFFPSLVPEDQLAKANGRFSAYVSLAEIVGPAAAGVLIAAFSAPGAITADALSFLVAIALIMTLPSQREPLPPGTPKTPMLALIKEGLAFIAGHKTLGLVVIAAAALNFFGTVFGTLKPLFIVQQLHVKPGWYAMALVAGGVGSVFGSIVAACVSQRLNIFALLFAVTVMFLAADGNVSLLNGLPVTIAWSFGVSNVVNGLGAGLINAAFRTYVQTATPAAMLARFLVS